MKPHVVKLMNGAPVHFLPKDEIKQLLAANPDRVMRRLVNGPHHGHTAVVPKNQITFECGMLTAKYLLHVDGQFWFRSMADVQSLS